MKEIKSLHIESVPLYLPIEYKLPHDKWVELLNGYNHGLKKTKIAEFIRMYLKDKFTDYDPKNVFSISDIILDNDIFKTDVTFNKSKSSLATLVVYNVYSLKLVPVCNSDRTEVLHISMTHTPI